MSNATTMMRVQEQRDGQAALHAQIEALTVRAMDATIARNPGEAERLLLRVGELERQEQASVRRKIGMPTATPAEQQARVRRFINPPTARIGVPVPFNGDAFANALNEVDDAQTRLKDAINAAGADAKKQLGVAHDEIAALELQKNNLNTQLAAAKRSGAGGPSAFVALSTLLVKSDAFTSPTLFTTVDGATDDMRKTQGIMDSLKAVRATIPNDPHKFLKHAYDEIKKGLNERIDDGKGRIAALNTILASLAAVPAVTPSAPPVDSTNPDAAIIALYANARDQRLSMLGKLSTCLTSDTGGKIDEIERWSNFEEFQISDEHADALNIVVTTWDTMTKILAKGDAVLAARLVEWKAEPKKYRKLTFRETLSFDLKKRYNELINDPAVNVATLQKALEECNALESMVNDLHTSVEIAYTAYETALQRTEKDREDAQKSDEEARLKSLQLRKEEEAALALAAQQEAEKERADRQRQADADEAAAKTTTEEDDDTKLEAYFATTAAPLAGLTLDTLNNALIAALTMEQTRVSTLTNIKTIKDKTAEWSAWIALVKTALASPRPRAPSSDEAKINVFAATMIVLVRAMTTGLIAQTKTLLLAGIDASDLNTEDKKALTDVLNIVTGYNTKLKWMSPSNKEDLTALNFYPISSATTAFRLKVSRAFDPNAKKKPMAKTIKTDLLQFADPQIATALLYSEIIMRLLGRPVDNIGVEPNDTIETIYRFDNLKNIINRQSEAAKTAGEKVPNDYADRAANRLQELEDLARILGFYRDREFSAVSTLATIGKEDVFKYVDDTTTEDLRSNAFGFDTHSIGTEATAVSTASSAFDDDDDGWFADNLSPSPSALAPAPGWSDAGF